MGLGTNRSMRDMAKGLNIAISTYLSSIRRDFIKQRREFRRRQKESDHSPIFNEIKVWHAKLFLSETSSVDVIEKPLPPQYSVMPIAKTDPFLLVFSKPYLQEELLSSFNMFKETYNPPAQQSPLKLKIAPNAASHLPSASHQQAPPSSASKESPSKHSLQRASSPTRGLAKERDDVNMPQQHQDVMRDLNIYFQKIKNDKIEKKKSMKMI